jgi:hypothetical protein
MNLKNFWKIDKSMGESRFAQVCGLILLVAVIIFMLIKGGVL